MRFDDVKVIAAWLVESAALSAFLRASGSEEQARNLESAVIEVREIVAQQIGGAILADLMDGFADRLWSSEEPSEAPGSREIH